MNERTSDLEQIMAMTEAEIDAELRSFGIDPDRAADLTGKVIAAAVAKSSRGRFVCPLCGKSTPHEHTPEDIVIFRNGLKVGAQGSEAHGFHGSPASKVTRPSEQEAVSSIGLGAEGEQ